MDKEKLLMEAVNLTLFKRQHRSLSKIASDMGTTRQTLRGLVNERIRAMGATTTKRED